MNNLIEIINALSLDTKLAKKKYDHQEKMFDEKEKKS
jgi:hypothetical protein